MRSAGALAYITAGIDASEEQLRSAPTWRPGQLLLAEAAWLRDKIEQLDISWGSKLVVAIVGPSGAGKSTLLNALAGRDLSPTGLDRPTTRRVVIYAKTKSDAEGLVAHVGDEQVDVKTSYHAAALDYLILVDTPDTNTLPENQRLLSRVLERADLILTLFAAQNPRLHDNIAFLKPFVRQLPANAVVPVLNMVDRVPHEQVDEVAADFEGVVAEEWGLAPGRIYLISAKASSAGARFPDDETPLHDINQFAALQDLLFTSLNQASQVADQRLAHAEHLLATLQQHCRSLLDDSRADRSRAESALQRLNGQAQQALEKAIMSRIERGSTLDLHATLYSLLGPRWWGPVGWLVTLWGLLTRAVAFLGHLGRRSRPLDAVWGGATDDRVANLPLSELDDSLVALRQLYAQEWPPIADALVAVGFDTSIREATLWEDGARASGKEMRAHVAQAYQEQLARLSRALSAWPLQLLLNAPTIGMIAWASARTVLAFLTESYLPADFFKHAGFAIGTIWIISFILLQILVSLALRRPFRRRLARALADSPGWALTGPIEKELQVLRTLHAE